MQADTAGTAGTADTPKTAGTVDTAVILAVMVVMETIMWVLLNYEHQWSSGSDRLSILRIQSCTIGFFSSQQLCALHREETVFVVIKYIREVKKIYYK